MTQKHLPTYVINFRKAYEKLYALYLENGIYALVDENGVETPEFLNYATTIRTFIKINISPRNKSRNSNEYSWNPSYYPKEAFFNPSNHSGMAEYLRSNGGYNYEKIVRDNGATVYEIDDVLDILFDKILELELTRKYFLDKGNAEWAFRSMKQVIHNQLCDMIKKNSKKIPLPIKQEEYKKSLSQKANEDEDFLKKPCYEMVSFDSSITDDDGNVITLGSLQSDPRQDTEHDALLTEVIEYAKCTFIHEVITSLIEKGNPHYLITYINNVSGRSGCSLSDDLLSKGGAAALKTLTQILKKQNIDVDYLNNITFMWQKYIDRVKADKRVVDKWLYESNKYAREISYKRGISM